MRDSNPAPMREGSLRQLRLGYGRLRHRARTLLGPARTAVPIAHPAESPPVGRVHDERDAPDEVADAMPPVSVVLATRRPHMLDHAAGQLRRQRHRGLQVILGLHGDGWTSESLVRDRLVDMVPEADIVVVASPAEVPFGTVLDELTSRCDGDVVTKWDDDDWYGATHLEVVVGALTQDAADVVGRRADFVYLEAYDETIQRSSDTRPAFTLNLAGGTLTVRRELMGEIGGWGPLPRHVDRSLIERIVLGGGWAYAVSSRGYLLRRTADPTDHTWNATPGYFQRSASATRPGLDLAFAGVA